MNNDIVAALCNARSFFLAGVMQGSREGEHLADQSYRRRIGEMITAAHPDAEIRDPGVLMVDWLGARAAELRAAHGELATADVVDCTALDPAVADLTEVFVRLVRLAAASDVCVAWLPDHEASMGTAVEMWAARQAGRTVVTISPMRQNLAVLSCSSHIVPDIEHFAALLSAGSGSVDHYRVGEQSGVGRG